MILNDGGPGGGAGAGGPATRQVIGGAGTPTRDWLAEAIRRGWRRGCLLCRPDQSTCPEHAADAVLDACRAESLFIMPAAEADEVIRLAAQSLAADPTRPEPLRPGSW
jgi:hypothetical protein